MKTTQAEEERQRFARSASDATDVFAPPPAKPKIQWRWPLPSLIAQP